MGCSWVVCWGSGLHEAGDGLGGLLELLLLLGPALPGGVDEAVRHVVVEQVEREGLERLRRRGDLGQDVDAVLLLLDHPLDAADLPLDPPQALEVGLDGLVVALEVAVLFAHAGNDTPRGYLDQGEVHPRGWKTPGSRTRNECPARPRATVAVDGRGVVEGWTSHLSWTTLRTPR